MAAVLVVDDDDGVRQLVVMILKRKGYDVFSAANGLEGLMVFSSYRSRIDLVLTDVDMPQMNGLELTTRIRAGNPSQKIMLMSGRTWDAEDWPEGCRLLAKPFLPGQVIAAVESVLAE